MDPNAQITETIEYYRKIGFLTSTPTVAEVAAEIDLVWGASLDEVADSQAGRDLAVLTSTDAPIFDAGGDGYRPGENAFVSLITRCAALAPDLLTLGAVTEEWADSDTPVVTVEANGTAHQWEPMAKYIDTSILAILNESLPATSAKFWACDALGMPSVIALLTDDQRTRVVADRGWDLQPDPPAQDAPPSPPQPQPSDAGSTSWWKRRKR